MTARLRVFLLAAATLAVLGFVLARHPRPALPSNAAPESVPDITLQQTNGTALRLSGYAGKVVLLDFFATWCSPCRDEIPRFVQWQSTYGSQGLQVIGVSMDDDPRPVAPFSRELGINYPVVLGTPQLESRFGGILGLPANIVLSRNGKVVSKHLGLVDLSHLQQELTAQLALEK